MDDGNEVKIVSEILPFFERDTTIRPSLSDKNEVSKFTFGLPGELVLGDGSSNPVPKDEDGDYVVQRKGSDNRREAVIYLEYSISTDLKLVGLQIWRAALLLADFVIHSRDSFSGKTVLELGSGVGLTGIIAGMFARQVICTDLDIGDILNLIRANIERNKKLIQADMNIETLDFFNLNWSKGLRDKLSETEIVLAGDVIYDNDVTEAFVHTVGNILSLPPKKTMYIGMEKRYVFTIDDLNSVAPCFEHFKTVLESARCKPPFSQWTITEVPIDFPQYFNYERTKELIMIKIST